MTKALTILTSVLGKMLPEGRIKGFLRETYYRSPLNTGALSLESLGNTLSVVKILEDGTMFVETTQGLRFYAPRDKEAYPPLQYTMKHKRIHQLSSISGIEYYWGFLAVLREIFIDNIYEQRYQLREGDVVIDVGAHLGLFTVRAAQAVGQDRGLVIAVEPDEENIKFLKKNIAENSLSNVKVIPKGAWSKQDRLKLYQGSHSMTSSLYRQELQSDEFVQVEVDTLDNMLRDCGVRKVDFLKMDIEGAEIEALKGMTETLRQSAILVICAYHKQDGKATCETLVPQLANQGFKIRLEHEIIYGGR